MDTDNKINGIYLMPEGQQIEGSVIYPQGRTPVMIGIGIEEPIRQLIAKHYGFWLPSKDPNATGPDIMIPPSDKHRVGFEYGEIKPANIQGVRKAFDQFDNWRQYGGLKGKVGLFIYDELGNVYLFGIYDL